MLNYLLPFKQNISYKFQIQGELQLRKDTGLLSFIITFLALLGQNHDYQVFTWEKQLYYLGKYTDLLKVTGNLGPCLQPVLNQGHWAFIKGSDDFDHSSIEAYLPV